MEYIPAKTILSPWFQEGWFASHYNMNIYRGCCHGCIYCDSRSECYGIQDFDRVRAKENALEKLAREIRSKRKKGVVLTGSMSDPYNPYEKEARLTRGALSILNEQGFGAAVMTKSPLAVRDADVLCAMLRHSPASVSITITTAQDALCRKLERRAAPSSERFAALNALAKAGVPCGVLLMPLLPFINDTLENVRQIVQRTADVGARWIFAFPDLGVTLRQNQRAYFYDRLQEDFPGLREKYMRVFGNQYACASPHAASLWEAFTSLCAEKGLMYRMEDISAALEAPYRVEQLSLLP